MQSGFEPDSTIFTSKVAAAVAAIDSRLAIFEARYTKFVEAATFAATSSTNA